MRMLSPYWTQRTFTSDLFDEMDRMMEGWTRLPDSSKAYDERAFNPACEVVEAEEHYMMSVDLPGMRKEDIQINVTDNILTISGERKREFASDKKDRVQRFEKSYGFFKRSFTLPATIDAEKVEARYEDGVLEVYLPKTQLAKPRQIEVQSGKAGGIFEKLLGTKKSTSESKDVRAN